MPEKDVALISGVLYQPEDKVRIPAVVGKIPGVERVQMDVEYAREWTVWKDLTILGKTVKTVLARAGSY